MDAAIKVVVDIQNKEEIKKLTKDIEQETQAVRALDQALKAGTITKAQFNTNAVLLGQSIANATNRIKQLEAASAGMGRGLGQLAYAIDDVQYGFNAIVNNIPQIVMGLGGSIGLAGAVGIAAVAVNQLMKHWGELSTMLQGAWAGDSISHLMMLAEKAEEAAKAFEKLAKTPTSGQAAETKGVGSAITEAGTEGFTNAVALALTQDPKFRAKVQAQMPGFTGFIRAMQGKGPNMDREVGDAARAEAEKLVGATQAPGQAGESARLQLQQRLRDIGQGGLADQIAAAKDIEANKQLAKDWGGERSGEKEIEALKNKEFKRLQEEAKAKQEIDNKAKQDAHRMRIQELEDQRTGLLAWHHMQDQDLAKKKDKLGQGSQTFTDMKAVSDYYMKGAADAPLTVLAKAQKVLNELQYKELQKINEALRKEQRAGVHPG